MTISLQVVFRDILESISMQMKRSNPTLDILRIKGLLKIVCFFRNSHIQDTTLSVSSTSIGYFENCFLVGDSRENISWEVDEELLVRGTLQG